MKNAHERFGKLVYRRRSEKTATNIRVFLDAFVGEERGKAHLVSVVGGDVEIGALSAAFANGDSFTVIDPHGAEEHRLAWREAAVFSRLDHGSRPQAATAPSGRLLAGIGGHNLGWEAAPDQRRPCVHLVFAGAPLRLARHSGMGRVDDLAIAAAKADAALCPGLDMPESRSRRRGKQLLALLRQGAAKPAAHVSRPRMAPSNGPKSSSSRRLPDSPEQASLTAREPTIRQLHTHFLNSSGGPQLWRSTYRRPHLCVVRRHERPSSASVRGDESCRSNQRLHPPASDRGRHPGRLRASANGRDAPPASEVAAGDDRHRISSLRVANRRRGEPAARTESGRSLLGRGLDVSCRRQGDSLGQTH